MGAQTKATRYRKNAQYSRGEEQPIVEYIVADNTKYCVHPYSYTSVIYPHLNPRPSRPFDWATGGNLLASVFLLRNP